MPRVHGRPRVIIADDHPGVLAAATSILSQSCEVVASVTNGISAIDGVDRLRPDVLILDIAMKGLDGFQTCTRIRSSGSDVRIIFLSNHTDDDYVLEGLSRGANGFVRKSRMVAQLADAVGHVHARRAFVPSARLLPRWPAANVRHHLQLHATDASIVDAAVSFLENALETGQAILVVVSDSHRRAIDVQLAVRGHDLADLADTDRYITADAEVAVDTTLRNGWPDRNRYADAVDPLVERALRSPGASGVSAFGELAGVLYSRGLCGAMLELEEIAGEYSASREISILCGCPIGLCRPDGSDLVVSLCDRHETIVPADPAW